MQSVRPPPIRNKIDLADPAQVRAWTRRLGINADSLRAIVEKMGDSVSAVTKEVELQRAAKAGSQAADQSPPAEDKHPASA